MRKILILFLVPILFTGCSEDSVTPKPTPFALNLIVADSAGVRLSGVEVRADVEIPGFNPVLNKSATIVGFGVAVECDVVMNIIDMEGRTIRVLGPLDAMPGAHQWALTSNDEDLPSPGTGLYRYEMVASNSTGVLFRGEKIMTQYDSFDFDRRPVLGVTDDQGRVSCTDRTRFPFLYELGPQPGRNENNNPNGDFNFSSTVAFTLTDTLANEFVIVEAVVNSGLNIITLVWDDTLAATPKSLPPAPDATAPDAPQALPPAEWYLDQNYPNPFN